jgi:hypothetical protein
LNISRALLLLVPSMYSEKNGSVGAARALPSAKTSGRATAAKNRAASRRPRDVTTSTACGIPRAEPDRPIVNPVAVLDKAVYDLGTICSCADTTSPPSGAR